MNPIVVIQYLKYIGIAIVIAIIGYCIWDIQSTYKENDKLKSTIKTHESSIKALKDDVVLQKKLNSDLLKRKQEVELVEKERIVYVDRIKKGDTKYIEKSKKEAEDIKVKTPNELDKHYVTKYNSILECIEDTTKNKENKCDTP